MTSLDSLTLFTLSLTTRHINGMTFVNKTIKDSLKISIHAYPDTGNTGIHIFLLSLYFIESQPFLQKLFYLELNDPRSLIDPISLTQYQPGSGLVILFVSPKLAKSLELFLVLVSHSLFFWHFAISWPESSVKYIGK